MKNGSTGMTFRGKGKRGEKRGRGVHDDVVIRLHRYITFLGDAP
jgi:hypothetical protein